MSIDARPEQENGDRVDCWECGNVLVDGEEIANDTDGFAYHSLCHAQKNLLAAYEGLIGAYLNTGVPIEKAKELAVAALAHHGPALALAREIVEAAS